MCKRVVDQTVPVYFVYKVENTFEMSEYIVPAEPRLHLVFILISMLMSHDTTVNYADEQFLYSRSGLVP